MWQWERKALTAQTDTHIYLFSLSKDDESQSADIISTLGLVHSETYSFIFRKNGMQELGTKIRLKTTR